MSNKYSRRKFLTLSAFVGMIPPAFSNPINAITTMLPKYNKKSSELPDLERIGELLKQQNDPLIWIFTGDSITHGAHHTHGCRSYPEIFGERVRWEMRRTRDIVINTGISGNITDDILNDFQWRVAQFDPTVVSVMIGTNDCARANITTDYYEEKLDALINKIREIKAIPVLHTPNFIILEEPYYYARLSAFIPIIQKVAKEKQLILVDNWNYWQEAFKDQPEADRYKKWLDDPIHPNHEGHIEIARLLFKDLNIFDVNAPTCGGK